MGAEEAHGWREGTKGSETRVGGSPPAFSSISPRSSNSFLSSSSVVRDLSKGGKTEYTTQKHTMDLNQKSLVRQNLAGMLQGTRHAPV